MSSSHVVGHCVLICPRNTLGPVRNQRGTARSERPQRVSKEKAARPSRSKPKTAEDLDKELDQYVHKGADDTTTKKAEDVEMA